VKREDLEHIVRAAATVAGDDEIVVVGSQAILGQFPNAPDVHVLAKCVAGRQRDWEFAREAIRHGVVEPEELLRRVPDLPLPDDQREQMERMLASVIARRA
jgi:hypothetical protein